LMSGERKRSVAAWPKLPRLSSTLPAHPGYRASRKPIKSRNGPGRRALIRPKSHCELVAPDRGADSLKSRASAREKGRPTMRRNFAFLLGTVTGACLTFVVMAPQGANLVAAAKAAARSDAYTQLN